jgi:hypothetical protein
MKQLLALLIIFSVLWHTMSLTVVFVSFKINQDYIAKNLCIDRDKPDSDCHGCCQLKKELGKQQEKESPAPENELKKIEIQYFQVLAESLNLIPIKAQKLLQPVTTPYHQINFEEIFHPPRFYF